MNKMKTQQLLDENEAYWQLKLHIGCGGVYLSGYVNIDAQGEHPSKATREQLLQNARFVDDYYAKLNGTWDKLPEANTVIAFGSSTIPLATNSE